MSMADRDGKIWFDGQFIDWRDAKIHVLTHSLHYGMSVFEGVRAYHTAQGTAIFRLSEHTQRLLNSAKIFQMKVPFDAPTLEAAQKAVVRENHLHSCYIRPLIWLGDDKLGISPAGNKVHVMIAAWPWGAYLGEEGISKGIRVKTASFTRHHVNVSMVRAKAGGHYINSILANSEALADGYDEALLLDTEGYVSEGSGENLFIVKKGKLYTPDLASCLDGITRDSVLTIAHDLGIETREKRITRDEVYCADEAFFTGTAAEVTPIRELDRRVIGKGQRGPITEKIQTAFFDAVQGKTPAYRHWLQSVNA
ncbi:MAG: branched-chain amino acid transaminase [Lautropia sp.]|nr:branched-chain amino acid transaminase [Lautropia sp.]